MHILGVYNIKGGVGKTATAVNLAYLAAAEGSRTLVWDLDPPAGAVARYAVALAAERMWGGHFAFGTLLVVAQIPPGLLYRWTPWVFGIGVILLVAVLVVLGERDMMTPAKVGRRLAERLAENLGKWCR